MVRLIINEGLSRHSQTKHCQREKELIALAVMTHTHERKASSDLRPTTTTQTCDRSHVRSAVAGMRHLCFCYT